LQRNPVAQCTKIVTEVNIAGWLGTAEDSLWHSFYLLKHQ
jgi:hypothetical protein